MNKLDSKPSSLTFTVASDSGPLPAHRLIVLVPISEIHTPDLEHQIWRIARSLHLNVLLVGLYADYDEYVPLRHKLVKMAAIIKDPNVSTDILIEQEKDWVGLVRRTWRTGDVVACYADQKTGLMRKPLDQVLKSRLGMTIYTLSDYQPIRKSYSTLTSQMLLWLGTLAIAGGFLWAEVKIINMPQDWAHTMLIYACILVEFPLIFLWNSLFP